MYLLDWEDFVMNAKSIFSVPKIRGTAAVA